MQKWLRKLPIHANLAIYYWEKSSNNFKASPVRGYKMIKTIVLKGKIKLFMVPSGNVHSKCANLLRQGKERE
jgi:hypothetical protein